MKITNKTLLALRLNRQFLIKTASEHEYDELYRDMQPGLNVYWNGFGQPPTLSYRASFNDIEYNRMRQQSRRLTKGRFQNGNIGWVLNEEIELFAALYKKPLTRPSELQMEILHLIEREGPMDIPLMKEMTGLLVKKLRRHFIDCSKLS